MNLKQIDRAIAQERATIAKANVTIAMAEARLVAFEELRRLHSVNTGSTVDSKMETEHRVAISKSRSTGDDKKFDQTCHAKGHTRSSLATALGITKGALSRYRSGDRKVPAAVREKVESLIEWPASRWPKLGE